MFGLNKRAILTEEQIIKNEIEEHERYIKERRYAEFYGMYRGENDILNKTVSSSNKPCNKLVNNYAEYIVNSNVGYFMGNPIVVNNKVDEKVQDLLTDIWEDNDKDDLFGEVAKECSIKGKSYVMAYLNELGEVNLTKLSPENVMMIKNSIGEVERAIRYYYLTDVNNNNKQILNAEVYTNTDITYYTQANNGELVLDVEKPVNPAINKFKRIPIVEFLNNSEEQGDIEKVETLINAYDKILSYNADEIESFRNAYLVLRNMIVTEDSIKKLREEGIIELGEGGEFSFATKDLNIDAVEKTLDRTHKNILMFSSVVDMGDESFGGNLSGVAIKFKILQMENKTIMKERKFTKGIKELLMVLKEYVRIKLGKDYALKDFSIQFTRNLPTNLTENVDNLVKLNSTSLIDKETLLSLLPFISNPQEILERVKQEKEQEAGLDYKFTEEDVAV